MAHVYVSASIDELDDIINQLNGLRKVAKAAYAVDSDPDDPDYKPEVKVQLETKKYGDGWDLSVTY